MTDDFCDKGQVSFNKSTFLLHFTTHSVLREIQSKLQKSPIRPSQGEGECYIELNTFCMISYIEGHRTH